MMKKILSLAASLVMTAAASVQSYETLWEQVENDVKKDLPQSALTKVKLIRDKAVTENNQPQLLRSLLISRVYSEEISSDSAQIYIKSIESALATESSAVMKALQHSALAQCYSNMWGNDEITQKEYEAKAREHFVSSLADFAALADADAKQYMPLVAFKKDSEYFNNDLLHVLLSTAIEKGKMKNSDVDEWLSRAIDFYQQRHQLDAALLLILKRYHYENDDRWVRGKIEKHPAYARLTQLISDYSTSNVVVKVYDELTDLGYLYDRNNPYATHNDSVLLSWAQKGIAHCSGKGKVLATNGLRNFIAHVTNPSACIEQLSESYDVGQQVNLSLSARNVKQIEVRVVHLFNTQLEYQNHLSADLKRIAAQSKKVELSLVHKVKSQPAYAWCKDSLLLTMPTTPGIYYIELIADGRRLDGEAVSVSHLSAIKFALSKGKNRVTVVNRKTGAPMRGATVTAYNHQPYASNRNKYRQLAVYKTDENGEVNIEIADEDRGVMYGVSTEGDQASSFFTLSHLRDYRNTNKEAVTKVQLYTDRAIYRPGQKVQFTGVVFTQRGDDYSTEHNYKATVELRNVNNKVLDSLQVCSDDFGTISGSFVLPAAALPGNFSIQLVRCSAPATQYFKVEEYKRPTFTATTQPLRTAYRLGDKVQVEGEAKTYSGLPVAGARVQYVVQRSSWLFWNDDEFEPQAGETVTNADGRFTLPVWLAHSGKVGDESRYNRYTYTVHYTVTAENGETVKGTAAVAAATRSAWLKAEVPNMICRRADKALPTFTIKQLNAAGEPMEVQGTYSLRGEGRECVQGSFNTGVPFTVEALATLPSGKYELCYRTPQTQADSVVLSVFNNTDQQPVDTESPLFFYQEKDEATGEVRLVYGTPCQQATLFFDIVANQQIVERKQLSLSNELRQFTFSYKPEYGDGAKLFVALLHGGKFYTQVAEVTQPLPNKQLKLQWQTFRSRLTPGQHEEWVLRVMQPDGQPANAQLSACLYDASLDVFASNRWEDYSVTFQRHLPYAVWNSNMSIFQTRLQGNFSYKQLRTRQLVFSKWRSELFTYPFGVNKMYDYCVTESRPMAAAGCESVSYENAGENKRVYKARAALASGAMATTTASPSVTPRSNFAETAFFRPALRTDSEGRVSIAFTLPESMTQWNFCALAHDQQMNYGRIDTTVVARKEFMVEPALPRYLRKGDQTELPVKVSNLTAHPISATLRITLKDAANEQLKYSAQQPINLAAGEQRVFTFAYNAANTEGMLVCRATAQGNGFSDGEEHYLPILTTDVEVTRTLPFSLTEKGVRSLQTDTLFNVKGATHRALSVELSSNPTWYAVTSLPALSLNNGSMSVIDWATRYYALAIGQYIAQQHPEVQQLVARKEGEVEALTALKVDELTDATPWLQQAQSEQQQAAALRQLFDAEAAAAHLYTAIDKIKALQQSDGSYSWFPGMGGNAWVTMDVATLMARTERLTATTHPRLHPMLLAAYHYLQKEMAKSVARMKEEERKHHQQLEPTELQLRYLYLRVLMQQTPDADAKYLLERATQLRHQLTMYGKALTAIVLAEAGHKEEAQLSIKSLLEYTVNQPEKGRYFDTPRAEWSWHSYRIPTQCAAIEAMNYFGNKAVAGELRLWLLQAKRTQMWETSRATTDAVYALLTSNAPGTLMPLQQHTPLYYTLYRQKQIVGLNAAAESATAGTVGYLKQTYTTEAATAATSLKIDKRSDGLSWGCVYATFMAPMSEVKTEGKGLLLSRSIEVKRGSEWQPLSDVSQLQKGDKVRQVFSITADRDYDFVTLEASRPANFVPVHPLSGYAWNTSLPAYRAVQVAQTDYFIEKLQKGTHRFAEEYFVDRAGRYASGVSRIKCVYAPEFQGVCGQ